MSRNTSVILGDHFEMFVERQVSTGQYHSVSEVICAGLRLLEEREQMIQAMRETIIAGEQSGPMQTIDREAFKDEMQSWKKNRARMKLKGEELSSIVLRDRDPAGVEQIGSIDDQWTDLAES